MGGMDKLLAKAFSNIIKNRLEQSELTKLEKELFLKHGMSIKLAMEHFEEFHISLKQILKSDAKKFEKDCLEEICSITKSSDNYNIKIIDLELINLLLEYFGEEENRKITSSLFENDLTAPEILKKSKVPKTSAYRKIENQMIDGLLIEARKVLSESKKVSKYKCIFDSVNVKLTKDNVIVDGEIDKKYFEKSTINKVLNL